jgi:hypothetical protein
MGNVTMHSGPPTSLFAQPRFRPTSRPSQWPAPATYRPPAAPETLPSGATLRHADVVVVILPLYRFG